MHNPFATSFSFCRTLGQSTTISHHVTVKNWYFAQFRVILKEAPRPVARYGTIATAWNGRAEARTIARFFPRSNQRFSL
ncbi:hypothetical protein [Novosphingobium sp. LASN5T]|uniref:hypothetical protein n=1 Tax=Novosphingobium sp. LASN5T TaxID=2491021 RepID=UPI000F5EC16D|nr:hypothetical protein [Novosphingobium sp. LASN5T]RQW45498.1 hypothetical protein EH199_04355 [Novosphingobium sp. LASN5T]